MNLTFGNSDITLSYVLKEDKHGVDLWKPHVHAYTVQKSHPTWNLCVQTCMTLQCQVYRFKDCSQRERQAVVSMHVLLKTSVKHCVLFIHLQGSKHQ